MVKVAAMKGRLFRSIRLAGALGWIIPVLLSAETYYVAPDGDDANAGSESRPLATVQSALQKLGAGDTLYIRGGVYSLQSNIRINLKGSPDAWITIAGYPGEKPILDGSAIRGEVADNNERDYTIVQFDSAAYIRVRNLHVRNSWGSGFLTYPVYIPNPPLPVQETLEASTLAARGSRHIELIGCSSTNSYGPGIGFWHSEHITVRECEVAGANDLGRRRNSSSTREAPHEAISIAAVSHFEVSHNHVHDCIKEGIDVKETSRHGTVHNNHIHHLKRQGLYVDSWFGLLGDVEFHSNIVHDCEWGIAVSAESGKGAPSKVVDVRIHHNLFYNNRASGVFFSVWGNDLWRENIAIWNNTIANNGRIIHWAGPTGGIDIRSRNVRNLTIVNNIVAGNGAFEIASIIDPVKEADTIRHQSIVISHNLVKSQTDQTKAHKGLYPNPHLNLGQAYLMADPRFVDPQGDNYQLAPESPAIGAGSTDWRLPGLSSDLGAIPHAGGIQ